MEDKFLSAEELLNLRKRTDKSIGSLQVQGEKSFAPNGSWLEEKQLDCVLRDIRDVISEEKVTKLGELCHGEWKNEIKKVVIDKEKGKALQFMGERINNKKQLNPEEALFLLEIGAIEISYCNTPVSIQQSYALFFSSPKDLEKYYVFAHLSRHGYTVKKHQGRIKVREEIRQKNILECSGENPQAKRIKSEESTRQMSTNVGEKRRKKLDELIRSTIPVDFIKNTNNEASTSKYERKPINFPNMAGYKYLKLAPPPSHLIPQNVEPQKSSYKIYRHFDKNWRKFQKRDNRRNDYPSVVPKFRDSSTLTNWTLFKKAMYVEKTDGNKSQGSILWSGKTKPLINVNEIISTEEVQSRIQLIKEINFSKDIANEIDSLTLRFKIDYDVYQPGVTWSKYNPSLPNIRICITNAKEALPNFEEVEMAQKKLKDEVPLYFAVVNDNYEVSFYSFTNISVPKYVPLQDVKFRNE